MELITSIFHRKLSLNFIAAAHYAKLPNSRHVLLIASSLKPLHLRDFLSEFYSDPDHSVSRFAFSCYELTNMLLSSLSFRTFTVW